LGIPLAFIEKKTVRMTEHKTCGGDGTNRQDCSSRWRSQKKTRIERERKINRGIVVEEDGRWQSITKVRRRRSSRKEGIKVMLPGVRCIVFYLKKAASGRTQAGNFKSELT